MLTHRQNRALADSIGIGPGSTQIASDRFNDAISRSPLMRAQNESDDRERRSRRARDRSAGVWPDMPADPCRPSCMAGVHDFARSGLGARDATTSTVTGISWRAGRGFRGSVLTMAGLCGSRTCFRRAASPLARPGGRSGPGGSLGGRMPPATARTGW
jgi:hypothetical protein